MSIPTETPQRTFEEELELFRALDKRSRRKLEQQFDTLTEPEQLRMIQQLEIQTEEDIRAFSLFLRLPTITILISKLLFVYNYFISGLGSTSSIGSPKIPFTSYAIYAEHPILATEISVVTLQFTIYLLSSLRWDTFTHLGMLVCVALGTSQAVTCQRNGQMELLWWMLPVFNILLVRYAQLNMRRSRRALEGLAQRMMMTTTSRLKHE